MPILSKDMVVVYTISLLELSSWTILLNVNITKGYVQIHVNYNHLFSLKVPSRQQLRTRKFEKNQIT